MAHQSPMISIPKKTTEEVDWTTPIRNLIAQSYGENPGEYAAECAALQRCRQDAVRGAGSDITARDLLYKYFGQLELLELRFSEIRVNFPWHDAFTNKLTTQSSIAYEKASVLFQIASTHSSIAASQSRSDPEGLKRAFYYFRACAGMLTYINENFLHAPSTDLSREVVKFLVGIILAQATEVFFEKCTDEKKGAALVSKIGSQAASMYNTLTEDVKEFMGKGIFDRNWVTLLQIKAKYFSSLTQYYRGLADNTAGNHGDALSRFTQAEVLAKEASRSAASFSSMFVSTMSPNLPADAGTSIMERTKAHHVICLDKKNEATRENDLIYNAIIPAFEALPNVDKTVVATPIGIHEIYGSPDVQKTIGQDLFIRLVPLSVHESASVYSEEKAKLVRGEVEKAEGAEAEARTALAELGVKEGLSRFKAMAEGQLPDGDEIPLEVRRWKEDITLIEDRDGVQAQINELAKLKQSVQRDLDDISRELDTESRECELLRVKYEHLWTQPPSATLSKTIRTDVKSHLNALEAAAVSDQQVIVLWDSVRSDIQLLLSPQLETVFRERAGGSGGLLGQESLMDLVDVSGGDEADEEKERTKIRGYVSEIEERLKRLNLISRERKDVLKDLKDKIQTDDVSHLLLLNRRNSSVEPALFAAELEKFKPYQQRLASTVVHQESALQEVATLWKSLKDLAGRGSGARKWEEREKKKKDTVRRFSRARDGYMEVRDGLAKGLQFYTELTDLSRKLRSASKSFVSERTVERESLVAKLEAERRLSAPAAQAITSSSSGAPPPRPPPPQSRSTLDSAMAAMSLGQGGRSSGSPAPGHPPANPPTSYQGYGSYGQQQLPPPPPPSSQSQYSVPPPPPPSQSQSQYGSSYNPSYGQYGNQPATSPPPPPPQRQSSHPPPLPPHQQHQHQYHPSSPSSGSFLPPPPPRPPTHSSNYSVSSPPPQPAASAPPAADPYASLGLFNPTPPAASAPPPPPPQQQHQQQHQGFPPLPPPPQGQGSYYQYASSYPPPPPSQPQSQPGYPGYNNPPPPPGQGGYYHQQQPQQPPPPQQQQQQHYGGYGGQQQGGYQPSYGSGFN